MNFFALNLPAYPGESMESDILTALTNAKDASSPPQPILVTVDRGFDAEILDAIMARPQPQMCPLVRFNIWTEQEQAAVGGQRAYTPFMVSLYCFYYFGVPAADPTYNPNVLSFTQQRRRHIQAINQAIAMQTGGNSAAPIAVSAHWKWDAVRPIVIDYQSPFRFLEQTYQPLPSGYNCVRIDRPVSVWQ